MLTYIVLGIVGIMAAVLIFAATRPGTFHIERSTDINAPPAKIFAYVNDFKAWTKWSPYENLDANLQRTYGGADSGKGATYAWSGNKAGTGTMEITESTQPSKIVIDLRFTKPFQAHNVATFTFAPQGDVTRVTWAMDGASPFVAKVMGLFFSMDKMLGKDFEAGLADLKKVSAQ